LVPSIGTYLDDQQIDDLMNNNQLDDDIGSMESFLEQKKKRGRRSFVTVEEVQGNEDPYTPKSGLDYIIMDPPQPKKTRDYMVIDPPQPKKTHIKIQPGSSYRRSTHQTYDNSGYYPRFQSNNNLWINYNKGTKKYTYNKAHFNRTPYGSFARMNYY
jgi:hypothetical protein